MRKICASVLILALLMIACKQAPVPASTTAAGRSHVKSVPPYPGPFSQFIPIDSANTMLGSYLNSVNSLVNDTDLRSVIINADSLRRMLNDSSLGKIASVKLMFAHTLSYINGGGANQYCGYQSGALTLIIAGYDNAGNYLYYPANAVLDFDAPCPANCPPTGSASGDILTR